MTSTPNTHVTQPTRPTRGSAAETLRRLRWSLTVVFTALNAAGLIVVAWLFIDKDSDSRSLSLESQVKQVTESVARLVVGDRDGINLEFVQSDPLNQGCPQFSVLPAAAGEFEPYHSVRPCVAMDERKLLALSHAAASSGRYQQGYEDSRDGGYVYVAAKPLLDSQDSYIGAIIAVIDADAELDQHRYVVLWVVLGGLLAVSAVGVLGHWLSGRAIRPAAAALEQQEVLLAETAHDLRTPVAALRALAETAIRNPSQGAELLPRTVRLAARMGSIIDDLLVRARLAAGVEKLAIQPVWLDQLVNAVVEETPTDGAQVTVTTTPTQVHVDPTLVQRAVGNLVNNALRYGRQPGSPAIVHITVAGGRVTVADHGPGIDAAIAEENFDRFTSGGGSSGLGLAIVRWTAQAHGGMLSVYNAAEGGAIFELAFPQHPTPYAT